MILSNEILNAYLDGELDVDACTDIEAALAQDSRARDRLAQLLEVSLLARACVDELSRAEVPKVISQAVLPLQADSGNTTNWAVPAWATAALLVIGIGIGVWVPDPFYGPATRVPLQTMAWHQQAAWFHKLAAERKARSAPLPLDFEHNDTARLTTTLGEALEYPIVVPDLSPQGFGLLGARVLIEDVRPLAQLFYHGPDGKLVSLLVALDTGPAVSATALAVDDIQVLVWRSSGSAYVLAGDFKEKRLSQLATLVMNDTSE